MELEKGWNGWNIEEVLGEGSFGKVYKIVREEFGYKYKSALKVLEIPKNQSEYMSIKSEGLSDESVNDYFESAVKDIVNEFALMSKLKGNSNIVSYEDHQVIKKKDEFGWEIFIRMELLTPLYSYLETHELTVKEVIQLGIDMCKALEVCQKYNIIHRDIKPENIFVSDIGTFKLGDFGIAKQLEKTTLGMSRKGTFIYMAPEVYKGYDYNSTVDIYSLGIVLYRYLNNNRAPFMPPAPKPIKYSDQEQAIILRLSGNKIPKPINAEGRLSEIVLKACAYDPKDRYESPRAMREELQAILYSEDEKVLAYPKGDKLENNKNEYVTNTMSKIQSSPNTENVEDNIVNGDDDDGTVVLEQNQYIPSKDDYTDGTVVLEENKVQNEKLQIPPVAKKEKKKGSSDKKEKKSKRGLFIAIGLIGIIAIAIAIFVTKGGKSKEQETTVEETTTIASVEMLDLTGYNREDAERLITDLGLIPSISEAYSDTVEANKVISQDVQGGTMLEEGQSVAIVVSKGKELFSVPDVKGKKEAKAKKILTDIGMKVKTKKVYSSSVGKGKVVSQSVNAGKAVEKGTTITLKISKGKKETPSSNSSSNSNYSSEGTNSSGKSNTGSSSNSSGSKDKTNSGEESLDDWELLD